jgi:hypothetical protein
VHTQTPTHGLNDNNSDISDSMDHHHDGINGTTDHHLYPLLTTDGDAKTKRRLGVVVHAYVDPIYDRSSFHIVGTPDVVTEVVVDLVRIAITDLSSLLSSSSAAAERIVPSSSSHPTINNDNVEIG